MSDYELDYEDTGYDPNFAETVEVAQQAAQAEVARQMGTQNAQLAAALQTAAQTQAAANFAEFNKQTKELGEHVDGEMTATYKDQWVNDREEFGAWLSQSPTHEALIPGDVSTTPDEYAEATNRAYYVFRQERDQARERKQKQHDEAYADRLRDKYVNTRYSASSSDVHEILKNAKGYQGW